MKQHIFTKGGVLLAVMLGFLTFFACRQDQLIDTSPSDAGTAFKQSARQYYENALADLRKANIDKAKTDARFTALDFTPNWNAAIIHKGNGKTYVELPVKFTGNSRLMTSGSSGVTQFNPRTDIQIPTRLIISKSENGDLEGNFMVIRADSPYSNGILPDFNLSQKMDNFTGREYLFNLNGTFNKGWNHKNGNTVNTFILGRNDVRQQQLGVRYCSAWFLFDSDGRIIQQLTPWVCLPEIPGGANGWNDSNAGGWGSSGNGTTGGDELSLLSPSDTGKTLTQKHKICPNSLTVNNGQVTMKDFNVGLLNPGLPAYASPAGDWKIQTNILPGDPYGNSSVLLISETFKAVAILAYDDLIRRGVTIESLNSNPRQFTSNTWNGRPLLNLNDFVAANFGPTFSSVALNTIGVVRSANIVERTVSGSAHTAGYDKPKISDNPNDCQ